MKNLDYEKMVSEIDAIVSSEFSGNMELKELPGSGPYTQEEALQMSGMLGRVYMIAHAIHCGACQANYLKES